MSPTIYLDYNATTPLDSGAREAMLPYMDVIWGNPSSIHQVGRKARARLDEARERSAEVLGAKPSEVVFTSGGTEANNLAILGVARLKKPQGRHLITSSIEHHAVLHCFDHLEKNEGFEVTRLGVDREGRVDPEVLRRSLRDDTVLVSIMAANNEIGTLQPVAELGRICRERGILFHTDAVQYFGKEPFSGVNAFAADLVSLCGHKFYGPKGAGLLWIRSPLHPEPLLWGGPHENERRAGTENLAGIQGLVWSMEHFVRTPVFDRVKMEILGSKLITGLMQLPGCEVISPLQNCLKNTVAMVGTGFQGMNLLAALDVAGICASSGSACSAGSLTPSHVVEALGRPESADSLVRFSMGRETTETEIDRVLGILPSILDRLHPC